MRIGLIGILFFLAQPARAGQMVPVRFELLDSTAASVQLRGSFDNWQGTHLLNRDSGGLWTVIIPLTLGNQYQYKFVVDGKWITDPKNPLTADDGFGAKNSVLIVESGSGGVDPGTDKASFTFVDTTASQIYLMIDVMPQWGRDSIPMTNIGNGVWNLSIGLPAGVYRYAFLKDTNPAEFTDPRGIMERLQRARSRNTLFHQPGAGSGRTSYRLEVRAPNAQSVEVAGEFNEWKTPKPMEDPDGDGVWAVTLDLPRGIYQYKLILDRHEWIVDPWAEDFFLDPSWNVNSVLVADTDMKGNLLFGDGWRRGRDHQSGDLLTRYFYAHSRAFSSEVMGLYDAAIEHFRDVERIGTEAHVHYSSLNPWNNDYWTWGMDERGRIGIGRNEFNRGDEVAAREPLRRHVPYSSNGLENIAFVSAIQSYHAIGASRRTALLADADKAITSAIASPRFSWRDHVAYQERSDLDEEERRAYFSEFPPMREALSPLMHAKRPVLRELSTGGWIAHLMGRDSTASAFLRRGVFDADKFGSAWEKRDAYLALGVYLRHRGDTVAAGEMFNKVLRVASGHELAQFYRESPPRERAVRIPEYAPGILFAGLTQKGRRWEFIGQEAELTDILRSSLERSRLVRWIDMDSVGEFAIDRGLPISELAESPKLVEDFATEARVALAAKFDISFEGPSIVCEIQIGPPAAVLSREHQIQISAGADTREKSKPSLEDLRALDVTDTITALMRRRQARFQILTLAKSLHWIGETPWGDLAFAHPLENESALVLVDEENLDRKVLFAEIARQKGYSSATRLRDLQGTFGAVQESVAAVSSLVLRDGWFQKRNGWWLETIRFRIQGPHRLADMMARIRKEIVSRLPLEADVIAVESSSVLLNIGKDRGVEPGAVFEIARQARTIADATTGEEFQIAAKRLALFRLSEIAPEVSRCEIVSIDPEFHLRAGLRAKLVAPEAAPTTEYNAEGRLRIEAEGLGPVFPVAINAYAKEPIGRIKIFNPDSVAYGNIRVLFQIPGFMDLPFEYREERLFPYATLSIPVSPVFSSRILELTGDQFKQAKIEIFWNGAEGARTLEQFIPIKILSRNSMTWQKPELVAAFANPRDPAIQAWTRQIFSRADLSHFPFMRSKPISRAIALFEGMREIRYVSDPSAPFIGADTARWAMDYIQYPTQTLAASAGDCDDLAVLYSTLLEAVGIPTKLILTPGHIFVLLQTDIDAAEWKKLGLARNEVVLHQGKVWLAVETTFLKEGFLSAVAEGAKEIQGGIEASIPLAEAWEKYEPTTLGLEPVNANWESAWKGYREVSAELKTRQDAVIRRLFEEPLAQHPRDTELRKAYGAFLWSLGRDTDAETQWLRVGEIPESEGEMKIYLAVLELRRGNDAAAVALLRTAAAAMPGDYRPSLNLARVYAKANRMSEARQAFERAVTLRSELRRLEPEIFGTAASSRSGEVPVWQQMAVTRASDISESESTEVSW